MGLGVGVGVGSGVGDTIGVWLGVGVWVGVGGITLYSLVNSLDVPFLNWKVVGNTFELDIGCPGTIKVDPFKIFPDVGLNSNPIFFYLLPPNNQPYLI